MKKGEKGFTLVEMLIAIVLLGIFLAAVWGFFSIAFTRYQDIQTKSAMDTEGRNIENFISDQINEADQISITATSAAGVTKTINPLKEGTPGNNIPLAKADLYELNEIKIKHGTQTIKIQPVANSAVGKQGKYKLEYVTGGTTFNTISNKVESITLSREKNSDNVKFICRLNYKGETKPIRKAVQTFTVSLAYKEAYTP